MNLCDINVIKRIMSEHSLRFRKEFGQNFLTDRSVVERIADGCCNHESSVILEIGPGIGTLTQELCLRYPTVVALEIDRGLIPVLHETMSEFDNLTVINADVMKTDIAGLLSPYMNSGSVSVCANLPYYITTPILMKLLESGIPFDYITVMIQTEVAERLCASAGDSEYGAITAAVKYYGETEALFTVGKNSFMPPPGVTSTVVRIHLYKEKKFKPLNEKMLFRVIRASFGQRRKTLPNSLSSGFPELTKSQITDIITSCGLPADIRGERLDISDFVRLSNLIYTALGN